MRNDVWATSSAASVAFTIKYLPQMKRAYDALAALIEQIANPPKGNVTPLRKNKPA